MKVQYLFSKNKKIGSRIISWAAKFEKLPMDDLPSHVAVLVDEQWVIESTLTTGVRIAPYDKWKEINQELHKIPCSVFNRDSKLVLSEATAVWNKKYDWSGIMYFALCYIGLILFKKPLPKQNKWQKKNKYFCTEYIGTLTGIEHSMSSPAKLLCDILECIK